MYEPMFDTQALEAPATDTGRLQHSAGRHRRSVARASKVCDAGTAGTGLAPVVPAVNVVCLFQLDYHSLTLDPCGFYTF